jgi:TusA-related sulfurtransferase
MDVRRPSRKVPAAFSAGGAEEREGGRAAGEGKLIARGLRHPGPIHMVRTQLAAGSPPAVLRVIVDSASAADGLARFCQSRDVPAEVDLVGEEFHILIRLGRSAEKLLRGPVDPGP